MSAKLKYGNWIRKKNLWMLGLSALGISILAFLPLPIWLRIAAGGLGAVLSIIFLYPLYAYLMFSPQGGNMQEKIYALIIGKLEKPLSGKILDIGAGNGILAIKLAQRFSNAQVTGMDYWGRDWEYAKSVCEENARIASVAERVRFVKGDAAALDFADSEFDAVVSNLTFHEVKSAAHKGAVVREALRMLKPGGFFAFVDYFYESRYYSSPAEFEAMLDDIGMAQITFKPLREALNIPILLQHPKALGKVGLLYGRK
jgi:SAM-dependent methyltransferase